MPELFQRVRVTPSWARGFSFHWTTDPTEALPPGTTFVVEFSETGVNDWTRASPDLPGNVRTWVEAESRMLTLDPRMFFRVVAVHSGTRRTSHVVGPFAELSRREFLLLRELMRQEYQQAAGMGGAELHVWQPMVEGARCTRCLDPTTGASLDGNCVVCKGTGKVRGYHGPYATRGRFSASTRARVVDPAAERGTQEPYARGLELVGWPILCTRDIIEDRGTGKRYSVDQVEHRSEIRGIPAVLAVKVHELPGTDAAYSL